MNFLESKVVDQGEIILDQEKIIQIKDLAIQAKDSEIQNKDLELKNKNQFIQDCYQKIADLNQKLKLAMAKRFARAAEIFVDPNAPQQNNLFDEAEILELMGELAGLCLIWLTFGRQLAFG